MPVPVELIHHASGNWFKIFAVHFTDSVCPMGESGGMVANMSGQSHDRDGRGRFVAHPKKVPWHERWRTGIRLGEIAVVIGLWGGGLASADMVIASVLLLAALLVGAVSIAADPKRPKSGKAILVALWILFIAASELLVYIRHNADVPEASATVTAPSGGKTASLDCERGELPNVVPDDPLLVIELLPGGTSGYVSTSQRPGSPLIWPEINDGHEIYRCAIKNLGRDAFILREAKFRIVYRKMVYLKDRSTSGDISSETFYSFKPRSLDVLAGGQRYFYFVNRTTEEADVYYPNDIAAELAGSGDFKSVLLLSPPVDAFPIGPMAPKGPPTQSPSTQSPPPQPTGTSPGTSPALALP
jgi:hypothetical protein